MKRMKRFRPLALGAGASLTLGLVGCGNGPPGGSGSGGNTCSAGALVSSGAAQVKIEANDNLVFAPVSDNAKVGQIVQWTNSGTVAHPITFDSSNASCLTDSQIAPGASWGVKFTQAGTYTYKCTIHPGMNGSLTVGS